MEMKTIHRGLFFSKMNARVVWPLSGPGSKRPGIQVDEIRAGIVAHATDFQIEAGLTQLAGIAPGKANIDGPPQHVIAEFGNTCRFLAQPGIRLGGAVTGDDVKWGSGAQLLTHVKEHVHQSGINSLDITGTVIPEDVAYLPHAAGAIGTVSKISDTEPFAGVGVVKREGAAGVIRQQGGPSCCRHQAGGQETSSDFFYKMASTATTHVSLRISAY